jgi:beta-phosphoglucomutase
MRLKAVLFDYDGVTADTPRLNYAAWKHVFAQAGAEVGEREYYLLEGHGPIKVSAALCKAHGISTSRVEALSHAKEIHIRTLGKPPVYDEIPGLLAALKRAGLSLGLVTGASRSRIEQSLSPAIRPYYDTIVTSDDVSHTKPDPEPYRKAAFALGVDPSTALVIENAPLGIQSAKAAGMICFALTTTLGENDLAYADIIFHSHLELVRELTAQTTCEPALARNKAPL